MNLGVKEKDIRERKNKKSYINSDFLISNAYSIIVFLALLCTLFAKLYHAIRNSLIHEYFGWVLNDLSFFILFWMFLSFVCIRWPRKVVVRVITILAAIICTWSFFNAGWLIRTGTQILPRVLLPLFRSPLNTLRIIGVNIIKMPFASMLLLLPGIIAFSFFIYVLLEIKIPRYNIRKFFFIFLLCFVISLTAVLIRPLFINKAPTQVASVGIRYNAQVRAIKSFFFYKNKKELTSDRKIPARNEVEIIVSKEQQRQNVVIVILEGIQYRQAFSSNNGNGLMPFLLKLSQQGVEFSNARSTLSHTTKALFALLTGRYPSATQDIVETVPMKEQYASLATILSDKMSYRTAFFQSARGDFEGRPGLVYNLGFDTFWARDDLDDPNQFVGYLGCDEFAMLQPVTEWIQKDSAPFLITILCSITHDPYEVPKWYDGPAKEKIDGYRQAISYTDQFIEALDIEISNLNLQEKTIFCVIGDHGEGFGEHGLYGHERIAFDEALHIPLCIRAPYLIDPLTKINMPVSSVDLTPTILGILGFDIENAVFDGTNVLESVVENRKVFFSGWMQEGPLGYVEDDLKYIYDPMQETVNLYNLREDPYELTNLEITQDNSQRIKNEILLWRESTLLLLNKDERGQKVLFEEWLCRWTNNLCSAKYEKAQNEGSDGLDNN